MIFTTSYKSKGFGQLLTSFIRVLNPKVVVELGVQQGKSTIAIARGLKKGQKLYAFDLFEDKYRKPPYGPTHANKRIAIENIKKAGVGDRVVVKTMNAFETHEKFKNVDVLHVDICNHFDNVYKVLVKWQNKVNKAILLEGGIYNHWQKEFNFSSFAQVLDTDFIKKKYYVCIIKGEGDYALTILTRR